MVRKNISPSFLIFIVHYFCQLTYSAKHLFLRLLGFSSMCLIEWFTSFYDKTEQHKLTCSSRTHDNFYSHNKIIFTVTVNVACCSPFGRSSSQYVEVIKESVSSSRTNGPQLFICILLVPEIHTTPWL